MNSIEDFCPEDMIEDATPPMERACGYFIRKYGTDAGTDRLFGILAAPMKMSGYVSSKQNYFISEIMGLRIVESILNSRLLRCAYSESQALLAIRECPSTLRSDLAFILICICGVDHDITASERSFLYDVIDMV